MDDLYPVTEPRIEWLDRADSTNRVVRDGSYRHGDVVATLDQWAGRGRRDRTWDTVPGHGVAMTVVLDPHRSSPARFLTRVPLLGARAVVETLRELTDGAVTSTVKWPNDVLVGSRKLAGILVETHPSGLLAVGIGLNVSTPTTQLPVPTATSIAEEGATVDPIVVVDAVARRILADLPRLDEDSMLVELAGAVVTLGHRVRIELPDGTFREGVAQALGPTGSLLVRTATGVEEFVAGDVTHVRTAPTALG